MDLNSWKDWKEEQLEPGSRKRLLVGAILGWVVVGAGAMLLFALSSPGIVEEPGLEVALAPALPVEPEPQPEPKQEEPPPPEPAAPPSPPPPSVASRALKPSPPSPREVPSGTPEEAPSGTPYDDPGTLADYQAPSVGSTTGRGTGSAQPVSPAPVVKKTPSAPHQVTEEVTPPVEVEKRPPEYPVAAKAKGVEGTVVVKYVVSVNGSVTEAEAVRGPAELYSACVTAVRGWRFEPAKLEGKPIAVSRIGRCAFKIRA